MTAPLPYRVRYQRRKTLALHVLEDGAIEVRAPLGLAEQRIARWVQTRTAWIAEARERVSRRARMRADPIASPGAAAWFLGQPLQLSLIAGRRIGVHREQDQLHITLPSPLVPAQAARALDRWYLQQARILFDDRFDLGVKRFRDRFGDAAQPHSLKLRRMRRRWGSCNRSGVITLNRELIKLPLALVDYVIAHELCHLLEFNHSQRFYRLLNDLMPDWRERETELGNH